MSEATCVGKTALVSGSSPIPDAYITASSIYDDWHGSRRARLNNEEGATCWLAAGHESSPPTMYLQIFPGLTANDGVHVVANPLPSPVIARCLPMYPLTWNYSACLRMVVFGCPIGV